MYIAFSMLTTKP